MPLKSSVRLRHWFPSLQPYPPCISRTILESPTTARVGSCWRQHWLLAAATAIHTQLATATSSRSPTRVTSYSTPVPLPPQVRCRSVSHPYHRAHSNRVSTARQP